MKTQLSKYELDALKEVVNIGAGNAATALSQLIKQRVSMAMPPNYWGICSLFYAWSKGRA